MFIENSRNSVSSEVEGAGFNPDLDLVQLNRQLAALINAHMHNDLRGMPEVERQVAISDVRLKIEVSLAFEQSPWPAALEEAIRKVDEAYTAQPAE
jgi:hypothetical protein